MINPTHFRSSDVRGLTRLATDATIGLADLVEAMHQSIARPLTGESAKGADRTRGITGLVYRTVRGITRLVGGSVETLLSLVQPALDQRESSAEREAIQAALNAVLGDYLAETNNTLAITMAFRHRGRALAIERSALAAELPDATAKIAIFVHGLCLTDRNWKRDGHDYSETLHARLGYTPVHLHYNTGRHISTNGHDFALMIDRLVGEWPKRVSDIVIVAHSMGGLVTRSACEFAATRRNRWLKKLRSIVFIGTPHLGAPLERRGHWVDVVLGATPYARPFARLGKIRSAGITDLRHGYVLDEDWMGRDRFGRLPPGRTLPLPAGVECFAIAATTGAKSGDLRDVWMGDGLVPVDSALGRHKDPRRSLGLAGSHQLIVHGCGHMDLLARTEVADQVVRWIEGSALKQ